jgi:hypothetical protein
MPARGQRPPGAPAALRAAPAGDGVAVLSWDAPAGQRADLFMINITQVDAPSGAALSATNSVPFRNTTATVRELQPGATYRFDVQAVATAYEGGGVATLVYTLPAAGGATAAARAAPQPVAQLAAAPDASGRGARVTWQPPASGPAPVKYMVQAADQSGRPLGTSYARTQPGMLLRDLPAGTPLEVSVQVGATCIAVARAGRTLPPTALQARAQCTALRSRSCAARRRRPLPVPPNA